MKIHWPAANPHYAHRAKIAYVDFEDEESMRIGLEKHAEVRFFYGVVMMLIS